MLFFQIIPPSAFYNVFYLFYHSAECMDLLFQDTRCLLCPLPGLGSEVQEYSFFILLLVLISTKPFRKTGHVQHTSLSLN